jgi:leucyl aminopeptidase
LTSFTTTTKPATQVEADLLVLPVFEGPEAGPGVREVSRALGEDLLADFAANGLKGKRGETLAVPTLGRIPAGTVLLAGVGKKGEAKADAVRRAAGRVSRRMSGYESVATTLAQVGRSSADSVQALVEGVSLGSYRFDRYKSKKDDAPKLREVVLVGADARTARKAISEAEVVAEATNWARDLVNTPSADNTPEAMAEHARAMAKAAGLKIKVWSPAELEKGGFGGVLGVGKGSANPPRLVELAYSGGRADEAPIALVGKGITFDSGGLSIKDARNMETMKMDKGGASAMLAAMRAIAALKVKANVIAILPFSENMPSGTAQRPGDVITHRNGKTSEVLNTDAEGRLILADALSLAVERGAKAIADTATLTGACVVALGEEVAGVMGNDRSLVREVIAASDSAGEPAWELPLFDGYRRLLDSPVADVRNISMRPYGGAITAALFLSEFVGDTPWVHVDVAGPAWTDDRNDLGPKGATGTPVRTMVRWVRNRASAGRGR